MKQYLNMIWAMEGGESVWLYKAEHDRLGIEIRGVVNQREQILASATIEQHNLDRLMHTVRLYREQIQKERVRGEIDALEAAANSTTNNDQPNET